MRGSEFRSSLHDNKSYLFLILALQFASALLIGQSWETRVNSLKNNGKWLSSKATLSRYVMCSEGFFKGAQSLHGHQLNLGAWHGFQEVLYKQKLHPRAVDFKFFPPQSSYFYFIFNKDDDGFSGIRIDAGEPPNDFFFTAQDNGKFTGVTPCAPLNIKTDSWNDCRIEFSTGGLAMHINGKFVQAFPDEIKPLQHIGFRGSSKNVLIDDIALWASDVKEPVKESFFNGRIFISISFRVFLFIAALTVILAVFPYAKKPRKTCLSVTLINLNIFVIASILFAANYFITGRYPVENSFLFQRFNQSKTEWVGKAVEKINKNIQKIPESGPVPESKKLILLGTSQAWGSGAKKEDETIARRIEQLLNESNKETLQFECINAGISSVQSSYLLQLYKTSWANAAPKAVIIILSNNDKVDPDQFRLNLEEFVALNKRLSIQTFFVLEASSPEYPTIKLERAHSVMKEVAAKSGTMVLDAHAYLKTKQTEGILWWDYIHLTSFGQDLLARYICSQIHPILVARQNPH